VVQDLIQVVIPVVREVEEPRVEVLVLELPIKDFQVGLEGRTMVMVVVVELVVLVVHPLQMM
jgi:hypothetical protein